MEVQKIIEEDIKDIRAHVSIMNTEMGQLRNCQGETAKTLMQIQTDVDWLKRFFFLVASSSIGALVVSLFGLILKK